VKPRHMNYCALKSV